MVRSFRFLPSSRERNRPCPRKQTRVTFKPVSSFQIIYQLWLAVFLTVNCQLAWRQFNRQFTWRYTVSIRRIAYWLVLMTKNRQIPFNRSCLHYILAVKRPGNCQYWPLAGHSISQLIDKYHSIRDVVLMSRNPNWDSPAAYYVRLKMQQGRRAIKGSRTWGIFYAIRTRWTLRHYP